MKKDLRDFMLDPNLIPPAKQILLSDIAAQSASMKMSCYLVGGFVRDLLLQKPVNDFDVVVEGNAIELGDELVRKYGGKLTVHRKFGTAIWFLPSETSETLDLIAARSETYKQAGALPTVKLAAIEDDISRRDFTINTMAVRLDGENFGELIDLLDGQDDLAQGVVRVLHPRSFMDDPTRIFRAVRYEQRYGFKIDADTLKLINPESFDVLSKLSGERIRHEFDLIFEEENAALMFSRLKELGVLDIFNLPEFNLSHSGLLNSEPPIEFGVSADRVLLGYLLWLMDSSKDLIHTLSKRFDFTFELTAASLAAIQLKKDLISFKDSKPSAWTFHLERFSLISIYALWLATNESALKEFLVKWQHIKSNVTGDDLKARGIAPGPRYKEILSQLRAARLDGEVENAADEEKLLQKLTEK